MKLRLVSLTVAIALAAVPALAQSPRGGAPAAQTNCQQPNGRGQQGGNTACVNQNQQAQRPAQPQQQAQSHEPRIGDNARNAPVLRQAARSRLAPPPAGQEYRVMNDRVVRVDSQTAKIIAIIGLYSALIR